MDITFLRNKTSIILKVRQNDTSRKNGCSHSVWAAPGHSSFRGSFN